MAIQELEVRKIFRDHGDVNREANRGQRAITVDDFKRIAEIAASPDEIIYNTEYLGNPVIQFKQKREIKSHFYL